MQTKINYSKTVEYSNMTDTELSAPVIPLIPQAKEVQYIQFHDTPQGLAVGADSCKVVCPLCKATVYSRVEKVSTSKTHSFVLKLCFMMCCCPCALCIPYCMDSCKAANHFCPQCDAFLGTYDH